MSLALCVTDLELGGRDVERRRLSLEAEPGEVLGIAGPPGVGKSTLLRLLSGQLPARAAVLEVLGVDALREPRRVWESVGYLRGDRESFLWRLSARDNLRHHAAMKRLPAAQLDREVRLQLRRVGLLSRAGASPRFYERDDRLRLAMAHAWLDDPRLAASCCESAGSRPQHRTTSPEHRIASGGPTSFQFERSTALPSFALHAPEW